MLPVPCRQGPSPSFGSPRAPSLYGKGRGRAGAVPGAAGHEACIPALRQLCLAAGCLLLQCPQLILCPAAGLALRALPWAQAGLLLCMLLLTLGCPGQGQAGIATLGPSLSFQWKQSRARSPAAWLWDICSPQGSCAPLCCFPPTWRPCCAMGAASSPFQSCPVTLRPAMFQVHRERCAHRLSAFPCRCPRRDYVLL